MALPTQAQLAAIDAASGGTASVPLTPDQQQIVALGQSQATSSQTAPGPIPYTAPINAADPNGYDSVDSATFVPPPAPTAPDSQQPAATAPPEDAGQITNSVQTSTIIDTSSALGNPIIPQANVLDQYASYTYSLSWYALTPAQFTALQNSAKFDTSAWSLLMQSGGAQGNTNRNKYFNLDYYMDDLVISTSFNDNGPSSVTDIEFTVTEPNGITLLQNLNLALRDLLKQPTGSVVPSAQYCMVIRFYGYNAQGDLVTNISPSAANPSNPIGGNSSNTVIVKYIPFTIKTFSFKNANRAVVYNITGAPVQYLKNASSALGSVPFNLELTGETVDDVLNGKVITNASAGDTGDRGAANTPSAAPKTGPQTVGSLPPQVQAALVTGTDPNAVTDSGMAFGGGGL